MRRDHAIHDGMRMPSWMARTVYGVGGLCLASGLLWLGFHYFLRAEGEFGPVAHPLERWWLVLHGGAALLAAWTLGIIWLGHVKRGIAHRGGNWSTGVALLAALAFLFVSGWGLYYLGDEAWRERTATAHWVVGLIGAALLWWHVRPPKRG